MAETSLTERACNQCGATKPLSEFWHPPSGQRWGTCKPCARQKQNTRRRLARAAHPTPKKTTKPCCTCKEVKPRSDFGTQPYITLQGKPSIRIRSECKRCQTIRVGKRRLKFKDQINATAREYRRRNREEVIARDREYRENNRDKWKIYGRANYSKRKSAGYLPSCKEIKQAISETLEMARFGDLYLDAYSGELIAKPTIDHITPLSLGGGSLADNLCVTNRANNTSKGNRPLLVWMAQRCLAQRGY